jgi:hypothetical protein
MAYKSRFTDKPTKRVSAGQLAQKTKDNYSKAFEKSQKESSTKQSWDRVRGDSDSNRPSGTSGPGSGYTPGGDSFQNYSVADQATMFNAAGGRDNFINQAINLQSKYPRALDYQRYLNQAKLFQQGLDRGGFLSDDGGITRLQMSGANQPLYNAQGQQILSMQSPYLTAQAPTISELFGDMGRGLGSIAQGFAEKGTPMMQLGKAGLEAIQNLLFPEPTVVNYGGDSNITVREEPIQTAPQFPYNFETIMKPKPEPLQPSEMSEEQFMESYPELYSGNPLFRQQTFEPIRVSDMDMTGVTAQNFGLPSLEQSYNFLRNPQVETPLGNLRFDNVFSGNPQLGYGNTVMINGVPVDLSATIGQDQISGGLSFAFKKGGSVDKYAGLGYKLK